MQHGRRAACLKVLLSFHSQSAVRARNLERELAHNYREGRKAGREPRSRRERGER